MKTILSTLLVILAIAIAPANASKPSAVAWSPNECSKPLMLPERYFVSKYGKGKYRIDGMESKGRLNCIFIQFQDTDTLEPQSIPDARTSSFMIKGEEAKWRTYEVTADGASFVRREALIRNILPRQKEGDAAGFILLRIDGASQAIVDELTAVAEKILQDAA